jgi:hypothetical protein
VERRSSKLEERTVDISGGDEQFYAKESHMNRVSRHRWRTEVRMGIDGRKFQRFLLSRGHI